MYRSGPPAISVTGSAMRKRIACTIFSICVDFLIFKTSFIYAALPTSRTFRFNRKQGCLRWRFTQCFFFSLVIITDSNNNDFLIIFVVVEDTGLLSRILPHCPIFFRTTVQTVQRRAKTRQSKCNAITVHKRGRSALYSHYFAENRFARRKYRRNQFRMTGSFRYPRDSLCMRLRRNHWTTRYTDSFEVPYTRTVRAAYIDISTYLATYLVALRILIFARVTRPEFLFRVHKNQWLYRKRIRRACLFPFLLLALPLNLVAGNTTSTNLSVRGTQDRYSPSAGILQVSRIPIGGSQLSDKPVSRLPPSFADRLARTGGLRQHREIFISTPGIPKASASIAGRQRLITVSWGSKPFCCSHCRRYFHPEATSVQLPDRVKYERV